MNYTHLGFSAFLLASGCSYKEGKDTSSDAGSSISALEVLLVVDSSASMMEHAVDISMNIDVLTQTLNEVASQENGALFGLTTVSVNPSEGFTTGVDAGEAGTLIMQGWAAGESFSHDVRQALSCQATCWMSSEIPSEPDYTGTTGDCPMPDVGVTTEYLDCLCSDVDYPDPSASWDSSQLCGAGQEQPLEAALLTLCRAEEDPPDICADHTGSTFDAEEDAGTVENFLRDDSTVVVIIVTDEGDSSPMFNSGDATEHPYIDAFAQFDREVIVTAIGPTLSCEGDDCSVACNSGSASISQVERLRNAAQQSNGFYRSLLSEEDCSLASFTDHFGALKQLLEAL